MLSLGKGFLPPDSRERLQLGNSVSKAKRMVHGAKSASLSIKYNSTKSYICFLRQILKKQKEKDQFCVKMKRLSLQQIKQHISPKKKEANHNLLLP